MNTVRFSSKSTMAAHLDPAGGQKAVHEDSTKVMQERATCKQMPTSENCGPQKSADRYNEVVCPLSSETSPTSLKFSLSQLWSRQRIFQIPSSATAPMSRPTSAPPQMADRRSSIATLPSSVGSVGSSRRSSLGQQRAISFATATTASTSAPASSSLASSCTLPHTPEEIACSDHAESTVLVFSTSSRHQDALIDVQKRIMEGREQLDHYNSMIQRYECERAEAWESRAALQEKRDNIAREIEGLEDTLKNPASWTHAAAMGLNRPSIKRQNSLFSNTAGFLWSMPPPKESLGAEPSWEPVSETCCLSALPSTPNMATMVDSKLASATSTTDDASLLLISVAPTSPLSSRSVAFAPPIATPSPAMSSLDSLAQYPPCLRCKHRLILLDKQTLLRELQTDMDQIQERLSIMTSQIKHLQRTFVAPIERCLAEDRDVWARLSTAD